MQAFVGQQLPLKPSPHLNLKYSLSMEFFITFFNVFNGSAL